MNWLFEALRRPRSENPSRQLTINQVTAETIVTAFLNSGGRAALEKEQHRFPCPLVLTSGSYAVVYRVQHEGLDFAIKEAKHPSEEQGYCLAQLAGQALLLKHGYPHFAPYNPIPIGGRYLVQRFLPGTASFNLAVLAEIRIDLANYDLHLADARGNAILSPDFKKPILIDLSGISFLVYPPNSQIDTYSHGACP